MSEGYINAASQLLLPLYFFVRGRERREERGGWGEARGECERVLEIGERVNLKRQKT